MSSVVQFVNEDDGVEGNIVDENRKRDFMRAFYGDMALGSRLMKAAQVGTLNPYPSPSVLFANGNGGVPYPYGSLAHSVSNFGGLIHQYTAAAVPDGATPALNSYWLAGDELLTTLSAGDPSNPRIDLIEIKIDMIDVTESRDIEDANGVATSQTPVTKKVAQITKNVVAGTPSATPALPSGTAGYVPWCYVWVPTSFSAGFTDLEISDLRYPLGYSRPFVPANVGVPFSTNWPQQTTLGNPRKSGGATEAVDFWCPILDSGVRLLNVYIHADSNVDVDIVRVDLQTAAFGYLGQYTNTLKCTPATGISPSATVPLSWWCWGYAHGTPFSVGTTALAGILVHVKARASNQNLYGVSFELAGTT